MPELPSKLEQEALTRLADARAGKLQFERDFREGYAFAAPHRKRNVLSSVSGGDTKPKDEGELNTSFAFELCADFPTVIMNTFVPEIQPWAKRRAGDAVHPSAREAVEAEIKRADDTIFTAIAASNFYSACGETFTPDLALGTVGLWVDRPRPGMPVHCQPIPIRELEIAQGPYGGVDDRFVSRWVTARHLKVLLDGIELPGTITRDAEKDKKKINVTWGFWRDWDESDEVWQHVVLAKDTLVHSVKIKGRGSCPLIVARFAPCPEWAWGIGPLVQALPDLRHLDALSESKLKNLDLSIQPPMAWPDDSWSSIENGFETGMAYPVRPGSEAAIKKIYEPNPPDAAVYEQSSLEQRLRRLFFLDWPQQTGDTPPTATQWLDEMTMAQRRIGTPGRIFWDEFAAGTFTRFQYLLEKAGLVRPIKIDGKIAFLQPYNPAQLAAEQQEVAQFTRFVQITGAAFPEEFRLHSDGLATMMNIARKMGVTGIWSMRSNEDLQGVIDQIVQLKGGAAPGAPSIAAGSPQQGEQAGQTAPAPVTQVIQRSF